MTSDNEIEASICLLTGIILLYQFNSEMAVGGNIIIEFVLIKLRSTLLASKYLPLSYLFTSTNACVKQDKINMVCTISFIN